MKKILLLSIILVFLGVSGCVKDDTVDIKPVVDPYEEEREKFKTVFEKEDDKQDFIDYEEGIYYVKKVSNAYKYLTQEEREEREKLSDEEKDKIEEENKEKHMRLLEKSGLWFFDAAEKKEKQIIKFSDLIDKKEDELYTGTLVFDLSKRKFAFFLSRTDFDYHELYIHDVDTSETILIDDLAQKDERDESFNHGWSADGEFFMYTNNIDDENQLIVTNLDGEKRFLKRLFELEDVFNVQLVDDNLFMMNLLGSKRVGFFNYSNENFKVINTEKNSKGAWYEKINDDEYFKYTYILEDLETINIKEETSSVIEIPEEYKISDGEEDEQTNLDDEKEEEDDDKREYAVWGNCFDDSVLFSIVENDDSYEAYEPNSFVKNLILYNYKNKEFKEIDLVEINEDWQDTDYYNCSDEGREIYWRKSSEYEDDTFQIKSFINSYYNLDTGEIREEEYKPGEVIEAVKERQSDYEGCKLSIMEPMDDRDLKIDKFYIYRFTDTDDCEKKGMFYYNPKTQEDILISTEDGVDDEYNYNLIR